MAIPKKIEGAASPALTFAGIAGAFGLASCCALPLYLAALGISTAWLGDVGIYANFHRPVFLGIALTGLTCGAILLIWQRKAMKPWVFWGTVAGWAIGAILLSLGLVYV
jgi:mercuric ion transport protein